MGKRFMVFWLGLDTTGSKVIIADWTVKQSLPYSSNIPAYIMKLEGLLVF